MTDGELAEIEARANAARAAWGHYSDGRVLLAEHYAADVRALLAEDAELRAALEWIREACGDAALYLDEYGQHHDGCAILQSVWRTPDAVCDCALGMIARRLDACAALAAAPASGGQEGGG